MYEVWQNYKVDFSIIYYSCKEHLANNW